MVIAPQANRQVTLIDMLDRLLQGGVAIEGDVTLAVADIDLVRLDLRILLSSIEAAARALPPAPPREVVSAS